MGLKVAVGNAGKDILNLADFIAPNQEDDALSFVKDKYMSVKII